MATWLKQETATVIVVGLGLAGLIMNGQCNFTAAIDRLHGDVKTVQQEVAQVRQDVTKEVGQVREGLAKLDGQLSILKIGLENITNAPPPQDPTTRGAGG